MTADPAPIVPRYQPLVAVVIALSAGIVLDRYGRPDGTTAAPAGSLPFWFVAWWSVAACGVAAWWLARRCRCDAAASWLVLSAMVFTGAAWHDLRWYIFSQDDVGRYASLESVPSCATATVLSAPEILPAPRPTPLRAIPGLERSRVDVWVTGIRDGGNWLRADGRCQLFVDGHLLGIHAGDQVKVFAQLYRPSPPMNPGEFDFAANSRIDGRLAVLRTISPDCVTVVEPSRGWSPQRLLDAAQSSGQQSMRRYVGRARAGLASAVLLGAREDLPNEEMMPFFLTGTIHLLVVSGLNVGILAIGLYAALRLGWLPRRAALATIVAVVMAYTLLTGGGPPVMRSAVLVVLACVAAWTGRRGAAFNALAASALVVLAINPCELFQTGTQLSFLCVAILIWVGESQLNRRWLSEDPLDRLIRESRPWYIIAPIGVARWTGFLLVTTGAVWLATLPLVLYRFHIVSPVALLISPVVWLLALIAMWAGFLTLAGGWVLPVVALAAGPVCDVSLAGLVRVVNWAETLPAGHFWAPGPPAWWVIGFYLGLMAVMFWGPRLMSLRWQLALLCAWIIAGVAPPLARAAMPHDELRCSFVAMGHGACVVVETPDGKTLLYDAGSLGPPEYATQSAAGFLWNRGILRIDAIILSHADIDHYNAVPGLLERFRVGAVYVSPAMFDGFGATGSGRGPEVLRRAIEQAGVPILEIWAGDRLRAGRDVLIDVLHPPRERVIGNDNANSITLAVEYRGRRLLLPGDLESPGLDDLMAELPYDCDVLLAPHHGSRRSDPPGFAAWCTPEWVVISGGRDADPLVRRTYEQAGARVINSGDEGAVEFSIKSGSTRVSTFVKRGEVRAVAE